MDNLDTVKRPKFAMDLNFDTFFPTISRFPGIKVVDTISKSKRLLMLSSYMVKNCVEVLKRHVWICISFVYLTKQSQSWAELNESIYISKSFCVFEFDKVEVTPTPAENSFFKALVLLKL